MCPVNTSLECLQLLLQQLVQWYGFLILLECVLPLYDFDQFLYITGFQIFLGIFLDYITRGSLYSMELGFRCIVGTKKAIVFYEVLFIRNQ